MKGYGLISIILPTYNGARYIRESVESILKQTYPDWELIIVDDASTDDTAHIVQKYALRDPRISVIHNQSNQKLPVSLNIGFSKAKGAYYTWTSDDNMFLPDALEKMVSFLNQNQKYGMVYATCQVIDENQNKVGLWGNRPLTIQNLFTNNECGACFLYRADLAQKIGSYQADCYLAEDHEYWLRMRLHTEIAHLPEVLYLYRTHSQSLTLRNKRFCKSKDLDVVVNYIDIYLKQYPLMNPQDQNFLLLEKYLANKDLFKIKELSQKISHKEIYQAAKWFYQIKRDKFYLKVIRGLKFTYFFKALKVYFKKG